MVNIATQGFKIQGQTFNSLTVIEPVRIDGTLKWKCLCVCGGERIDFAGRIVSGHVKTCGCGVGSKAGDHLRTHGRSKTPEHTVWKTMRQRCSNKGCKSYKDYGGRGIKVSKEWDDFEVFLADMGKRPGMDYTLDRIDVNADYSKANCRWATWKEQQRNRRNNRILSHDGQSRSIAEWAEVLGFPSYLIGNRLQRGWSVKDALSIAPRGSTTSG